MHLTRLVLIAAVALAASTTASAQESSSVGKVYECGGEKMELTEMKDGRLALKGKGLTGFVSIHKPTGMYRGSVSGWGSQHRTPGEALSAACNWLLKRAKAMSEKELRERLHKFYEEWK